MTPFDRTEIYRWLVSQVEPDSVVELRILKVNDDPRHPAYTVSGYFHASRLDDLIGTALEWTARAEGVYITINPVNPDLLARTENRVVVRPGRTTRDLNIARRKFLVFDADPQRPAGLSATDAEKLLARERIEALRKCLSGIGWPEPIVADSGNGYHLKYRIDLANNEAATDLVKRVLKAADQRFSDDRLKIDQTLYNASRICKVYGTLSRKGEDTPDRPHRGTKVLSMPEPFHVVPAEALEKFAAELQPKAPADQAPTNVLTFTVSDGHEPSPNGARTDEEVVRMAPYVDGFTSLWQGELNGHRSQSEADLALVGRLAYLCGPGQAEQVRRLFLQSAPGKRE
jgi:hypothetical protein